MGDIKEAEPLREFGGLVWENRSASNQGRPMWQWHTDDELDWSQGVEPIADDVVGIGITFGLGPSGNWGILLTLDEEGSRRMHSLTQEQAESRAVKLAIAIRAVWPACNEPIDLLALEQGRES